MFVGAYAALVNVGATPPAPSNAIFIFPICSLGQMKVAFDGAGGVAPVFTPAA